MCIPRAAQRAATAKPRPAVLPVPEKTATEPAREARSSAAGSSEVEEVEVMMKVHCFPRLTCTARANPQREVADMESIYLFF
jgi:hypothetical protein